MVRQVLQSNLLPDTRSKRENAGTTTFSMDADANKPVGTGEGAIRPKIRTLKKSFF